MKSQKSLLIFTGILSFVAFYLCNRIVSYGQSISGNILAVIDTVFDNIGTVIRNRPFYIDFSKSALVGGLYGFIGVWLVYLYNIFGSKNYMKGKEHGSSAWGTYKDIKPLMDSEPDMNIPLSQMVQISSRKVKDFEADRNKNIALVGGSGSGKTYSEYLPSLMQLHSSYVVTDPKGTTLPNTGHMLVNNGYIVQAFNTIDFSKSLHYNPLAYIRTEKDILKVVNVLIENTKGEGDRCGEDFWVKAERLLYTALIAYLWEEAPLEERNIPTMISLLDECKVKEKDENYQNPVDILFEILEKEKPDCLAVRQYKKFKLAAGETMKSILISCAARLAPFDIEELREITQYDELQLDEIGDRKTALFLIMSDTDKTYGFLIAMIMYQMFNLLCEKADNEYGGKLPFHVRCLFDEFANIGKIPDFQVLISTIRSRGISVMIGLQSLSQLYGPYKDHADTILDCCDTVIFLGGKSQKTTKTLSEMIGKTTIDTQNMTESHGQSGSYSTQDSSLGRDLIDPSEIGRLQRGECLVLITGLPPFKDKKYPTSKHKRFCETHDGGAALFDLRKYDANQSPGSFLNGVTVVERIELNELNSLV